MVVGLFTMKYCYVEHVWFLYVLFIIFVLSIIAGGKSCSIIAIMNVAGAGILLHHYFEDPYLMWMTVKHIPDFLMGMALCEEYKKNKETDSRNVIVLLVVTI